MAAEAECSACGAASAVSRVTLYKKPWKKLLDMADESRRCIEENDTRLKTKGRLDVCRLVVHIYDIHPRRPGGTSGNAVRRRDGDVAVGARTGAHLSARYGDSLLERASLNVYLQHEIGERGQECPHPLHRDDRRGVLV